MSFSVSGHTGSGQLNLHTWITHWKCTFIESGNLVSFFRFLQETYKKLRFLNGLLAMDRLFPGTSTPLYAVTLVFHSSPSNGFGTILDVAGMYVHICNGAA